MNPNTEYELLVQEIYQQLGRAAKLYTADVQHDKKIEGKSGQKHQIDVYWEYEKGCKTHRVAIECKNYSRRISLEKVCAFKGVLDDLDGVSGIMVSKIGFQRGAKKYAKKYGISLKELRPPGYGETIIGEFQSCFHHEIRYTLFQIDEDWAKQKGFDIESYRMWLSHTFKTRTELWNSSPFIYVDRTDDILRNEKGEFVVSLKELEKQIPDHPTKGFPYVFKFDDAYLDSRRLGHIKVCAVKYDYDIHEQQRTIALDAGDLVKAILKDSQSDVTDFIALH